jgi:hypothetical protein
MMAEKPGNTEEELLDHIISEPVKTYITRNNSPGQLYVNPFVDTAFYLYRDVEIQQNGSRA